MSAYSDTLAEHRRLAILRFLASCADYQSNASILLDIMDRVAVTSTRDQVLAAIAWLHEAGLVVQDTRGAIVTATATDRGVEVAQGRVVHPGVQRPRPGTS